MPDRDTLIDMFLCNTTWADWRRIPLAGDASARRYIRLRQNEKTVILMDAPPENGENTQSFARIATYLTAQGFNSPMIHKHDPASGLMILSDLGSRDFASWLSDHPGDSAILYRAATDVLIRLHHKAPDFALPRLTPAVGGEMIGLLNPFYTDQPVVDLVGAMTNTMQHVAPQPDTIALRDYHAENLIWRPKETGQARIGLLDFQDAFIAPAGYDLVSLLRDVRRDVPISLAQEMTAYFIQKTGVGRNFTAQLACLGAQRNLRILGVFARLAKTRNKPRYLDLLPRVWSNLMHDLSHPELKELHQAAMDTLPEPNATTLEKLRA